MEEIEIIKKEFGVGSNLAPWGSCSADFLNKKAIEIAEKHGFSEDIIELFHNHPYIHDGFPNGLGAGLYFINLLIKHTNEKVI